MARGASTDDPYGWRQPTSHEVQSGRPWDASYQDGPAPWDAGRQHAAVVRLTADGAFTGPVLDVGCGTGENALHVAAAGSLPVVGIDVAETALTLARAKAVDRGVTAEFMAADVLQLADLGRTFATVLDCGLFHTFAVDERPAYVANLAAVTTPGSALHLLCFSDLEPGTGGPHRISERELRQEFSSDRGWEIAALHPMRYETRFDAAGARAWLATIERLPGLAGQGGG